VKALLIYTSDQDGEALEKKTRVSASMKVRILTNHGGSYLQRIQRELRICARLEHRNVLPVYGYAHGFGILMAIVSPWAENGNLTTYLKKKSVELDIIRRFQIVSLCYACRRQTDNNVSLGI
jgi:serine/threonine protein kinase